MRSLRVFLSVLLVFLTDQMLFSAPPPPPAGVPSCWPPPCVPIDGGISFLLVAGAAFGAKKVYDSRKNSSENKN
jgi:hypothetical protein